MNIVLNLIGRQNSKALIHYQLHINVPTLFFGFLQNKTGITIFEVAEEWK